MYVLISYFVITTFRKKSNPNKTELSGNQQKDNLRDKLYCKQQEDCLYMTQTFRYGEDETQDQFLNRVKQVGI